jgi:Flp pilus assembly protein TadB
MNPSIAALALTAAVLVGSPRPGRARLRVTGAPAVPPTERPVLRTPWITVAVSALGGLAWAGGGGVLGAALVVAATIGLGWAARRRWERPTRHDDDPTDLAASWAQLAACLEVGLPVAAAVSAAAQPLDGRTGAELRRVAGLLELGADPAQAWLAAQESPSHAAFGRAASRSAATGAALARAARVEAARLRAALTDSAEARAQRAGVLITAPLGLCFLPAFVVLGIVPVVVGLARQTLTWW